MDQEVEETSDIAKQLQSAVRSLRLLARGVQQAEVDLEHRFLRVDVLTFVAIPVLARHHVLRDHRCLCQLDFLPLGLRDVD